MTSTTNANQMPIPTGSAYLDTIAARLDSSEPLHITGLGDSLTYGWVVNKGFFDRFIDQLTAAFPNCPIRSTNAGIPGDTADGGWARLNVLLEKKTDIVTVQFGLNDIYHDIAVAEFQKTVERIAGRILKAKAIPVLVTSCPLDWEEGQRLAGIFYDAIRGAARSLDLPCASLDLYWEKIAGPPREWSGLVQADRLHPTDKGHALMADGLFEAIVQPKQEK